MTTIDDTTDERREIPGYPGYTIDRAGVVRNAYGDTIRATVTERSPGRFYLRARPNVNGQNVSLYIHRAMLLAFKGEPADPARATAAVLDGDHLNIDLSNLEWRDRSGAIVATRGREAAS